MLDDFGIVGVSWRQDGSEALARYALPSDEQAARLRAFAKSAKLAEIAYLDTCNRVEVIFARSTDTTHEDLRPQIHELLTGRVPLPGEAERVFKAWQGEGACEHVFLVAAGLDSAAVGEAEIVGQVRACRDHANEMNLGGARLALLFEEALRVAATVRDSTRLGEGSVSLAELAVAHIARRLQSRGQDDDALVALVGVSAMTERAALSLAKAGTPFVVVNRTIANARAMARRFDARSLALDDFQRRPPRVDVVLSATRAGKPVLTDAVLDRLANNAEQPPLCIDMAVPADIDPIPCARLGIKRIGMDDIVGEAECNREARLAQAAQARQLVDEALPQLRERLTERAYGPMFAALQDHYRTTAGAGVKQLLKTLKGLDAAQQDAVTDWAERQARRFAHLPTVGIRGLLQNGPEGSLEAFLSGLDENLAATLRGRTTTDGTGDDDGSET